MRQWDLNVESMDKEELIANYFDAVAVIENLVPVFSYAAGGLFYFKYGFTRGEINMLEMLRVGRVIPLDLLGMGTHKSDTKDPAGGAAVILHRLRKKLKPLGMTIDSAWGQGVCMPPASIKKLKQLVAEHEAKQEDMG